jgi:glycosyltransferase involved in cell wall biosynthesis
VRILQFNNYADPVGGAEVYAFALTRELRQRGHQVGFLGTAPDRDADEEFLRIVRRPRYDPALLTRDQSTRTALVEAVHRLRPELIHVHNVFAMGLDVLECLGTLNVPVVHTIHDFGHLCPNSWCVLSDGTPCQGGAGAKCLKNDCKKNYPYDAQVALHTLLRQHTMAGVVDLAICPSRYLADLSQARGFRNTHHLPYFIDPITTETSGDRANHELVFIGRLEPEKGVEYLLDAMLLVLREQPRARLTIVGGGSQAESLQGRCQRLDLTSAVTFVSHVPRAELGRYYSRATACVIPSVWSENSPLVAYECLFAGLPMIASHIGGIPELVLDGRTGFTFLPRNAEDLARKILLLFSLASPERARISSEMRAHAQLFKSAPHLEQLERLYSAALDAPHGCAPALPIDGDLLALLEQYGHERARLASLFHEHVSYIQQLERALEDSREHRAGGPGAACPPASGGATQGAPESVRTGGAPVALPFLRRLHWALAKALRR